MKDDNQSNVLQTHEGRKKAQAAGSFLPIKHLTRNQLCSLLALPPEQSEKKGETRVSNENAAPGAINPEPQGASSVGQTGNVGSSTSAGSGAAKVFKEFKWGLL